MTSAFLQGNTCVVGLQWGDEGKGKIVDLLAEHADVVVRYCGGANAGHTVGINGKKYSTHVLPVGIFRPHTMNMIGNGVATVVDAGCGTGRVTELVLDRVPGAHVVAIDGSQKMVDEAERRLSSAVDDGREPLG